ncbi:unnamed protein product [Rotaria sp. Silwood1]|nr:unnamed protein product [Rotaria sp. Silwood1]
MYPRFIKLLLVASVWIPYAVSYYECNHRLVPCGCGLKKVEMNTHIVNGEEAVPYSWPMIISLRYDCLSNGNISTHCCSGTILSESYILTAAHCVERVNVSNLIAGNVTITASTYRRSQQDKTIKKIDKIFIHPNWTRLVNAFKNDIAILHLAEPIDFTTNLLIGRTCLPLPQLKSTNDITKYPPSNISLVLVGWGFHGESNYTARDVIQQATLLSIHHNHSTCATSLNHIETQFCAEVYEGCKDACVGDSGGPIFRWIGDRWEQVGIVSYGMNSCTLVNCQIVFTRIAAFYKWIERVVGRMNNKISATPSIRTATATVSRPTNVYTCNKNNVSCGCGFTNVALIPSRIVGGEEAISYSWSMVVSLRYDCLNNGNLTTHCCGGTILNEYYILTAAHCVDKINQSSILTQNVTIAAGIHNLTEDNQTIRRVDRIFIHSDYTGPAHWFKNDIAILHLTEPLDLDTNPRITRTCRPPRMNTQQDAKEYPSNGSMLAVIGWGLLNRPFNLKPQVLQQLHIYAIHHIHPTCAQYISDIDVQFCAGVYEGSRGPCNGDSGGPVLQWLGDRWEQVGIASYVVRGCAAVGHPSVYTRLTAFHDWIEWIINPSNYTTTTTTVAYRPPTIYNCNRNASCGCGVTDVELTSSRIIGGDEAIPYSWSMIVSIRYNCYHDGNINAHCCGGTILNEYYILTAAHCVDQFNQSSILSHNITIVTGIHNLTERALTIRRVDQIFTHPEYAGQSHLYKNDIAILHLDEPLDFYTDPFITRTCRPPRINSSKDIMKYPSNGSMLVTIGWGAANKPANIRPQLLQQLSIYAIHHNDSTCARSIGHVNVQFCGGLYEGGKGICYGDSGGPVFQWLDDRWEQVGISSYVMNGCASIGYQSVFTRLTAFYDWIEEIVNRRNITTSTSTETPNTLTTSRTTKSPVLFACNRSATCGCGYNDVFLTPSRIVGGENAADHSWSMVISLRYGIFRQHRCGGTILSPSYILTAAHCVWGFSQSTLTVAAGITNQSDSTAQVRNVSSIYIHPNYTKSNQNFRNDIALLHVDHPFIFHNNPKLAKTCVKSVYPPVSINQYPKNGTHLAVIGWGITKQGSSQLPDYLQQTQVYVIDNHHPTCSDSINDINMQFCAGLYEGGKGQ